MTTDCNSRYVAADPEIGAQIAVTEAARNIVCSGGEPLAITNCLNFGNPYNEEVYWSFEGTIKGMRKAYRYSEQNKSWSTREFAHYFNFSTRIYARRGLIR